VVDALELHVSSKRRSDASCSGRLTFPALLSTLNGRLLTRPERRLEP